MRDYVLSSLRFRRPPVVSAVGGRPRFETGADDRPRETKPGDRSIDDRCARGASNASAHRARRVASDDARRPTARESSLRTRKSFELVSG